MKINANGNYTTNAITQAIFKLICAKSEIPFFEFSVGNESRCGSTIGPAMAERLGCLAFDIGAP